MTAFIDGKLGLKRWFLSSNRDLPWRIDRTPYAVWVSEVMLQQTQAAVVIPYFQRWMERFPTIESLAKAPLTEVLKLWEGLGYYSRARNLHDGAQFIVHNFGGDLPSNPADLRKIKGIGPYTVGAILSFAFHQRIAAVDGNVLRVLTRFYGISDDIAKPATVKKIGLLAENLLPDEEPWIINEALIELGATICQKKPQCSACPLKSGCQAYKKGLTTQLPVKSGGKPVTQLFRGVAVIMHDNHMLAAPVSQGKIMAGLWEFPYFELQSPSCDAELIRSRVSETLEIDTEWHKALTEVFHSFTRYRARLFPHLLYAKKRKQVEHFHWFDLDSLQKQPFSSGHRRIFSEIKDKEMLIKRASTKGIPKMNSNHKS